MPEVRCVPSTAPARAVSLLTWSCSLGSRFPLTKSSSGFFPDFLMIPSYFQNIFIQSSPAPGVAPVQCASIFISTLGTFDLAFFFKTSVNGLYRIYVDDDAHT